MVRIFHRETSILRRPVCVAQALVLLSSFVVDYRSGDVANPSRLKVES